MPWIGSVCKTNHNENDVWGGLRKPGSLPTDSQEEDPLHSQEKNVKLNLDSEIVRI